MTMLFAARLISGVGVALRMAGRVLDCSDELLDALPGLLDRAHIGRHRSLLEQQTEQRDQRNPSIFAALAEHG